MGEEKVTYLLTHKFNQYKIPPNSAVFLVNQYKSATPIIGNFVPEGKYQMVGKKTIVIATVLLVALIVISSFVYLNSQKPYTGKMESINVAYSPFESLTLFWVAQDQDFFSQNGLNVTSHKYDTGAAALSGVLNGEDDIVVGTTEFPFTANVLNGAQIRTISTHFQV